MVQITPLDDLELCSLAFECQPQVDFPKLSWNVTLPNTPKPTPRPPQPPSVNRILPHIVRILLDRENILN